MGQTSDDLSTLEVLLLFAEFAHVLDTAFARAGGRSVIKDNISLVVMCSLELEGPKRPGEIGTLTGLTSGGVTKVVTRLEDSGLVVRHERALKRDKRAVSVSLTARGHDLMGLFSHELSARKSDIDVLVKELKRFVD
jgi:DNA-binding MarR family transcriptional regulator